MTKRTWGRGLAGVAIGAVAFVAGWMSPTASNPRSPGAGRGALGLEPAACAAETPKPNACGCYRDTTGACYCGKKGACACPGDCEPKGCEEKRARQLEKEIAAETKKAVAGGHSTASKNQTSRGAEGEENKDQSPSKSAREPARLSPAKKKELVHLLDAYLAEHPEGKSQTISEVRAAVSRE